MLCSDSCTYIYVFSVYFDLLDPWSNFKTTRWHVFLTPFTEQAWSMFIINDKFKFKKNNMIITIYIYIYIYDKI